MNTITYKRGMIKNLKEKENLPIHKYDWDLIPKNILDLIKDNKIMEIGGVYGDPKVGNPIQYDHLTIEYEGKVTTIEAFNITMFLAFAEDPYIKRVFQVLVQFQLMARKS